MNESTIDASPPRFEGSNVRVLLPDPAALAAAHRRFAVDRELVQAQANLWRSIAWSALFSLGAATLWALVTAVTNYHLGLLAMVIGIAAGIGARRGGPSVSAQWVGAAMALFACLLADLLTLVIVVLWENDVGNLPPLAEFFRWLAPAYFDVLMQQTRSMGVVFWAIALWEGYRIPRRA